MLDADPNEAGTAPASVDTGLDSMPVTATVNPAPRPAPATVGTGFGDLGETPAPVQQAAPTVEPENADADLDARVAALLPNKSTTDWNAVSAFLAAVVPWPRSERDPGYVNLHYSFPDRADPKIMIKKGGDPTKDIASFMSSVARKLNSPPQSSSSKFRRPSRSNRRPCRVTPKSPRRLQA